MKLYVAFLTLLLAVVVVVAKNCKQYSDGEISVEFEKINRKNGQKFAKIEKKTKKKKSKADRKNHFKKMMKEVNKHNKGNPKFCQGANKFLALDDEEFVVGYLGRGQGVSNINATVIGPPGKKNGKPKRETLPESVSYREFMGPVNDQGGCGSCWAFAASHTVSGVLSVLKGEYPTDYSEQQLIDCAYGWGCSSGYAEYGFNYLRDSDFKKETQYPYTAMTGTCTADRGTNHPLYGWGRSHGFGYPNAEAIKQVVAKQPMTLAMYVAADFKAYQSGVYEPNPGTDCTSNYKLNHDITVAGYGTDAEAGDYWLLKNGWGADWGDHGYIKVKRGSNACNIEIDGRYPIVDERYVPSQTTLPPTTTAATAAPQEPKCVDEIRQCAYYGTPECTADTYHDFKQTTKTGYPCKYFDYGDHKWPNPCRNRDSDQAPWCYKEGYPNWDYCFHPC